MPQIIQVEFTVPDAPRDEDDTDEEYQSFNEGWQYDCFGAVVAAAHGEGIHMRYI